MKSEEESRIPIEFRIRGRSPDDGTRRRIFNVEKWKGNQFIGGLHVINRNWCNPMCGNECDFKSREKAMEALLTILGIRVDI